MSELQWIFAFMLITYITLGSFIAYFSRRYGIKSSRDYFVSGHNLGWFLASMTYAATTYSAFMMVGLVGLTYSTGIGALGFELAYLLVTVVILALLGSNVWKMARERGWISPSEMLSDLYESNYIGYMTIGIYLIAMIPYLAAQMVGVASIFEGLGTRYEVGLFVIAILTLIWIVLAGMWSVATTDAYQGIWMLSAALILIFLLLVGIIPSYNTSLETITKALSEDGILGITDFWSIQTFLAYTIPWIFFAVTNPQVVVRLYIHKDKASYNKSVVLFSIFGFIYTIAVIFIGLIARGLTELGFFEKIARHDMVTPMLVSKLNPVAASFIYISILAAAITTANSIVLAVASSFVRDLIEKRGLKNINTLRASNIIVAFIIIISAILAYLRIGFVVDLSVLTSVMLLPLAPVTIAAWLMPNVIKKPFSRKFASISLILGFFMALIFAIYLGPRRTFLTSYFGLPISAIILILSTIIVIIGCLIERIRRIRH
ncbi:MAG: sodium:solute symporter family protein [Candidatus Methanomethyliaceae archaeon]|nr:sodium:solute symporter family protein [Candidatus Methanomethyliaceae archaeon]MDW7970772.1 sodium:solute symporter family protein [Nitrososphaerota archaeon]